MKSELGKPNLRCQKPFSGPDICHPSRPVLFSGEETRGRGGVALPMGMVPCLPPLWAPVIEYRKLSHS